MIRKLSLGDEATLLAAVLQFKTTQAIEPSEHLADPATFVFVAEADGVVIGWAHGYLLQRVDGTTMCLLYEIDVAEPHRRRGVARSLLDRTIDEALSSECSTLWVFTDPENSAAHSLYAGAGAERLRDQALFLWRFDRI